MVEITLSISRRERDTIQAALRLWQRLNGPNGCDFESGTTEPEFNIANDTDKPLNDREIDELIERIDP